MIRRKTSAAVAAITVACGLSAAPGCGFAVKHPAITAGLAAGTLGFATCKLACDDYAACGAVAGGAGVFLGVVTAVALWLGGDGHSTGLEETAQPLPGDDQPDDDRTVLPPEPGPAGAPSTSPAPTGAPPPSPSPTGAPPSPSPPSPAPPSPAPPNAAK